MNVPHIEIEKMLFGDYRVQVWDDKLDSQLDREYFCRGIKSAFETAKEVKKDLFPELEVFYRNGDTTELTIVTEDEE